jgi:hypothetical protein
MKTEYVLRYKWNRKWKDTAWSGRNKIEAQRERDLLNKANGDFTVYRVVKTTETVIT